jgi:hypothetical protein
VRLSATQFRLLRDIGSGEWDLFRQNRFYLVSRRSNQASFPASNTAASLCRFGLIKNVSTSPSLRRYEITEKGREVLEKRG